VAALLQESADDLARSTSPAFTSPGCRIPVDQTDPSCDARRAGEPGVELPLPEHVHDLESFERGVSGLHRLETERGLDSAFELAMIRFDNVVEVFGRTVAYRRRLRSLQVDFGNGHAIGGILVGRNGMRWFQSDAACRAFFRRIVAALAERVPDK